MKKLFLATIFFGLSVVSFAQIIQNLPIPIGAGTAEVWNNSIYHFGGSNNWAGSIVYPRIYKYDGSNWAYHDSIPDDNVWDVESVLVGDYTYLVGGWPSGPSLNRRYNMTTGDWTYLTNSPNLSQTWGIAAEHLAGVIYLFNSTGEVFAYYIAGNSWSTLPSNSATGTWDMSSILYQNEIYILGWDDSTFYKYTPASNLWTQLANTPYQVGACAMGIINNLIYCVGGNISGATGANYSSIIVYDITTNSWAIDSLQISSKRHWMATAEYEGGLYVVGGIDSIANAVDIVEEIVPQGTAGIDLSSQIPDGYYLMQNYPNPFNPITTIKYQIPEIEFVTLKVYDVLGNEIAVLVNEEKPVGEFEVEFDANGLPSGNYFYTFRAGIFAETKKMVLIK